MSADLENAISLQILADRNRRRSAFMNIFYILPINCMRRFMALWSVGNGTATICVIGQLQLEEILYFHEELTVIQFMVFEHFLRLDRKSFPTFI